MLCFALAVSAAHSPLIAQAADAAPTRSGHWAYTATTTGSEAQFSDASRRTIVSIRCTRANRRISISLAAPGGTAILLGTTSAQRSLSATHNPATGLLTAEVPVFDRILDALSFSRGRFSLTVPGAAPLILPNWPEPTRAIEDCRN